MSCCSWDNYRDSSSDVEESSREVGLEALLYFIDSLSGETSLSDGTDSMAELFLSGALFNNKKKPKAKITIPINTYVVFFIFLSLDFQIALSISSTTTKCWLFLDNTTNSLSILV
jgi:hypothetical protein